MRPLLVAGLLVSTVALGLAKQAKKSDVPAPLAAAATSGAALLTPASTDGFERVVKPFLAENCFPCHGNEKHKKDLNFEAVKSVITLIDDRDRWDEVVLKLRHREMPPDEEPHPPEHQRQAAAGGRRAE